MSKTKFLNKINFPTDLKQLNHSELKILKDELREEMINAVSETCLLYTSPSPRDREKSRMPSSA